jgi:hypothetical protein
LDKRIADSLKLAIGSIICAALAFGFHWRGPLEVAPWILLFIALATSLVSVLYGIKELRRAASRWQVILAFALCLIPWVATFRLKF